MRLGMKFKKLVLGLVILTAVTLPSACFAQPADSAVKSMVLQYKGHNYTGCLQASQKILKQNPSNVYALYYQGLAYVQLGKKEEAITAFDKVELLSTNKTITKYAKMGSACLNSPEECAKYSEGADELDKFIKSNKFYDPSVQTEVNKKKLDRIRENINDELGGTNKKSEMPTNDEIANAVKTLAKVGFNPMTGLNTMNPQNAELMQMNMLLGNNTEGQYNGMNNMMPYLLMGQNANGAQKMSPELMQSMMMSQMQMY